MKIKELQGLTKEIETRKTIIARQRDAIRVLHDEIGKLLESFDCGIVDLETGLNIIEGSIDEISKVV